MTEITKYENPNSLMQVSKLLFESHMFPNAKNAAGVFCIVKYGEELGLPAVTSLQNICIVNGKLSLSGQSMLGIALKNDVSFEILEETKERCIIEFKRKDFKYISTFTIEDANRIVINKEGKKLSEKDVWKNYPQVMLKWRAVSQGLRVIASDFMSGLYTPEEITSIPDKKETGFWEVPPEPSDNDKGVTKQDVRNVYDEKSRAVKYEGVTAQDVRDIFTPDDKIDVDERVAGKVADGDDITTPQIKAIRTILSSKGVDAFYELFKQYLFKVKFLKNNATIKSMSKEGASELLSNFDEHLVSFFMLDEYHDEMKHLFNILAKKTQVLILMTLTYFVKDIDSLPKKITEDLSDEYANNYFELFLKAIANQYEGKLPVERWGDKHEGVLPPQGSHDDVESDQCLPSPPSLDLSNPTQTPNPEFGF